nr:MAG TPA: mRNA export factor, Nuclear pore Pore Complex, mRNA export [Caudoviricetes sp.]DAG11105.1 MAG TPA: mRNA export factor, Nuclear pore Pore Complex, mRNA export [Caudoviricetes sp.]DAH80621.1 MAG TPA: mRNA export factor, Nuclear pore Pore Complex, mRNA export [Caudoviricetes sp.]DAL63423.1 MAG TPA_asm: mRNA export factor, Nuclear pore Pore Complex, mRNA export [Caudoviricetes sp.]DAZ58024.1 MAG TPA: mRNA export factor, Nuclear pore Pore Complex, mRNA export [Caudoviricetes sp.]
MGAEGRSVINMPGYPGFSIQELKCNLLSIR